MVKKEVNKTNRYVIVKRKLNHTKLKLKFFPFKISILNDTGSYKTTTEKWIKIEMMVMMMKKNTYIYYVFVYILWNSTYWHSHKQSKVEI